jgi:hypothetical protein
MIPFLPLKHRLTSPLLFLLLVGGAIAVGEFWLRRQLPEKAAASRKPARSKPRRAPANQRRRPLGAEA